MNKSKIYVTQEGYNQYLEALQSCINQYNSLLGTRNSGGVNKVEGDYPTLYKDNELQLLSGQMSYLKEIIERLEIIQNEHHGEAEIGLGDIVTIQYLDNQEVRVVKLTGGLVVIEFGQEISTISINSPLGKALYGAKVGENVKWSAGKNNFEANIVSKEKSPEQKDLGEQPEK